MNFLFNKKDRPAIRIAGIYLLFGCMWILISDKVLHLTIEEGSVLEGGQTFKGVLFVLLSALLIFLIVRYETHRKKLKEKELIRVQEEAKEEGIKAEEEERNRISSELHDGIQQELAGISMMLERVKDEGGKEDLADIQKEVQNCIEEVRSISHHLNSFQIEKWGLKEALKRLPAVNRKGEKVSLHLDISALDRIKLSYFSSLNLYRITQELLLNVSKHSSAERVELKIQEDDGHFTYSFREDAPRHQQEKGIGLGEYCLQKRLECLDAKILCHPDEKSEHQDLVFQFNDHWLSEGRVTLKQEEANLA